MKIKLLFFLSLLIVVFQLLISFPIYIWTENKFNFDVELTHAIGLFGSLFLAISIFVLLITLLAPRKVRDHLLPALVLVTLLVYLQQNILVWNYGFLDGAQLDFGTNDLLGLVDLSVWLGGILIFILFRKKVSQKAGIILLFSGLLTFLSTSVALLSLDFGKNRIPGTISQLDKFSFSNQQNILLFILDGFQSDLFWELIHNEPGLKEDLTGFTFYPNTAAVFAKTYPTIPLLLTGRTYEKKQPFRDFLEQSYQDSLLTSLIDQGWDVGLYPYIKATIVQDDAVMSNVEGLTGWGDKLNNYLLALDLSLFRAVPHFLKGWVYNEGNFIFQKPSPRSRARKELLENSGKTTSLPEAHPHFGLNFLNNLQFFGNTESEKPAFRFYHLNMPHKPFLLDRELSYGLLSEEFSSYREYAYATVKLMISYLKELQRLGVYDHSAIIFAADHGGGEYTTKKYIAAENRYVTVNEHGRQKASGKSLLLIKPAKNNEPFKLSPAPASLLDVAPTIAAFAGIHDQAFEGLPVDEIAKDQQRSRLYYFYYFTGWDSKFLGDFEVYRIEGDVYDDEAWNMEARLSAPRTTNSETKYVLTRTVNFGSDIKINADYTNAFLVGDHYQIGPSRVASASGELDILLDLKEPLIESQIYLLELQAAALEEKSFINLTVNGQEVSMTAIESRSGKRYAFLGPGQQTGGHKVDIHLEAFEAMDNRSPLSISKLRLAPAQLAVFDQNSSIRFSENLDGHYLTGFWAAQSSGRWTSDRQSSFHFLAADDFCHDKVIRLEIGKFNTDVDHSKFRVKLNGQTLVQVRSENGNHKTYYYECEPGYLDLTGVNRLDFVSDKVVSPAAVDRNADARTLGVFLLGLDLSAKNIKKID